MSAVSLPVTRPAGRALLIGSESCRPEPSQLLRQLGFQCGEVEDPYAAMAELARRPRAYWAIVLSLTSLYREELQLIATVRRRYPHVEIWLTHTDGRAAALAEAMQLGAQGLLTNEGLHRMAVSGAPSPAGPSMAGAAASAMSPISSPLFATPTSPPPDAGDAPAAATARQPIDDPAAYVDDATGEPVLTAEELRALLQEPPPATLPSGGE